MVCSNSCYWSEEAIKQFPENEVVQRFVEIYQMIQDSIVFICVQQAEQLAWRSGTSVGIFLDKYLFCYKKVKTRPNGTRVCPGKLSAKSAEDKIREKVDIPI